MENIISLIPAIIVFGVLIIVHEFGHFVACRLSGVRVEKFSIGFGPELFHWQAKETRFSISLLPLGGFVSPAGEEVSKVGPEGPKKGDFLAAPVLSRIFIVIAGVAMNYLLAFVIFWTIFTIGRPVSAAVVGGFVKGYPAEESLLKKGDKILSVDDIEVKTWQDVLDRFNDSKSSMIKLNIARKVDDATNELLTIQIKPKIEEIRDVFGKTATLKRVGITADMASNVSEKYPLGTALVKAWQLEVYQIVMTHKALYYLVTGQVSPKHLMGPIGIVQLSGQAAQAGVITLLQLLAILSISLAVINLLPFPALDGGHLIFYLWELITRRRVNPVWQERLTAAGFFILMTLMVFVLWNDIVNLQIFEKIKNLFHISR